MGDKAQVKQGGEGEVIYLKSKISSHKMFVFAIFIWYNITDFQVL